MYPVDKSFNFGVKAGFNSVIPFVRSLEIDGIECANISTENKAGEEVDLFFRLNVNRFFVQPTITWSKLSGVIKYERPALSEGSVKVDEQMKLKVSMLEIPVLIGYHVVKENPYALSIMAGPSFRYNYKTDYIHENPGALFVYNKDSSPYGIGAVVALSVSTGPLFLDFSYDMGITPFISKFANATTPTKDGETMRLKKRENVISFSFGFIF